MSRRFAVAAVTAMALSATMLPLVSSSQQTEARWFDSVTASLPDGASDRFTSTIVDVPSTVGAVTNAPGVLTTSTAQSHSGWVNVGSTRVTAGELGGQSLASAVGLTYGVTAPGGTCASATSAYWTARAQGQIALGTTYTRATDRIASSVLTPGQKNSLCLTFPRSAADRAFFLDHAGRDLRVETSVALRSEAPATWDSTTTNVESRARVAFPRATPWGNNFSNIANSCLGQTNTVDLRWAWPDSGQQSQISSPAVNAWELWIRSSGEGAWQKQNETTGNQRTIRLSRNDLAQGSYDVKIIARLDSARRYWVEGTHILSVSYAPNGRPSCTAVRVNDAFNPGGPVVLP